MGEVKTSVPLKTQSIGLRGDLLVLPPASEELTADGSVYGYAVVIRARSACSLTVLMRDGTRPEAIAFLDGVIAGIKISG